MAKGYALDERSYLKLREVVAWWDRWKVQLISLLVPGRRNKPVGGGGGGSRLIRAKCKEGSQTNGLISVIRLDGDGEETGDAFDAYAFADKSSTDMTARRPLLVTDDVVIISSVGGDYFLIVPSFVSVTKITVMTNTQVDGSNKDLEKKSRTNVEVIDTDAESGWTVYHTGGGCP